MFTILSWLVFGLIAGLLGKALFSFVYPSSELNNISGMYTIGVGAAGYLVGGAIEFVLNGGGQFSPSGLVLGVVGATLTLIALHFAQSKGYLDQWIK